jgi:hypothetical protein
MGASRAVDKRAVQLAKGRKARGNPAQPPVKRKPARAKSEHLRRKQIPLPCRVSLCSIC